ncbi:MAG: hypothetical protein NVSMB5_06600 [Candidatus Velthaea sp.]
MLARVDLRAVDRYRYAYGELVEQIAFDVLENRVRTGDDEHSPELAVSCDQRKLDRIVCGITAPYNLGSLLEALAEFDCQAAGQIRHDDFGDACKRGDKIER